MNKKLVFAFYLSKNYSSEIVDIHFRCLEWFKDSFDTVEIVFILDDNYNKENLLDAQRRFTQIFLGKPISFSMVPNTPYREALVFHDYVATKLSEYELVFFAHNKGTTNVGKCPLEEIYTWVMAMYFYSLNYMGEVEDMLWNKKFMSYGPFLTQNTEPEKPTKYDWYYVGTFFWINGKKIFQYMRNSNIPLPVMGDRFYAEEFLANIYPSWPYVTAGSHGTRYLTEADDFYHISTRHVRSCYTPEEDGFYDFFNKILDYGKTEQDSK